MDRIRAAFFAIEFIISVVIVIILMAIFNKQNRKIRRVWAKIQLFICGIKLKIVGNFDENAEMLLINHQSMLDIIVLEAIHGKNLAWVAKKEIGKIPIIGLILKIPKMIPIDRQNPRSIVTLTKDIRDRVNSGRVVAIFPEGTRGRGDKLLKFQSGAKVISEKLNLKVQPVVLKNTKKLMDSKKFSLNSGIVEVKILNLVDLKDKNWFENTRNLMQENLEN